VKIGMPTSTAPLLAPGIVRWPAGDVARPGTTVPVTLVAAGAPVSVGTASITGAAAADFTIRANECSGKSLTLGSSCQIWVRFLPATAGTRLATLRVADGEGAVHEVAVQGFAYGGRTRVEMTSDPGDWIGAGKKWTYTVATSEIAMSGSRWYAGFGINGADGSWWSASFVPRQGDILVVGDTYANATRYPFNGTGPGLSVTGNGRGCNTLTGSFTVTAADFAPDGRLRSAGISFVQHCEGGTPALRGTWEFRAGDNTPLAPWLIGYVPPPPVTMPPSLVPNGSFEVDLSGWAPADATATRVVGGAHGNYAARITVAGETKAYGLRVSPRPIQATTTRLTYVAAAFVRSLTPGRRICLVLRESGAAAGLARLGRSCVTGTSAWQAFPPLTYTTRGSGGSLELAVEQLGPAAGDSFDVDAVSLRAGTEPSPGASDHPLAAPVASGGQGPTASETEAASTMAGTLQTRRLGAGFQAMPL
jgi:hypothetical protein